MSTFYQKGLSQDDELISHCLELNRNDQKTNPGMLRTYTNPK